MKIKQLILPTAENDHAPHLLQKTAFLMLCGLVVLSFAVTNLQSLLWQSSDWLVGTVLPAVVVEKTNDARAEISETPLKRSSLLDEAARLKAEDMARNGYFAHYSPTGVSPWYWFEKVGYVYAHAGENLAVHFTDSKAVVDGWLNSPSHRANIENANYLEIGVGTAEGVYDGFKTVFVVQLFGTPAAPIQPLATVPNLTTSVATPTVSVEPVETGLEVDTVFNVETEVLGEEVQVSSVEQDLVYEREDSIVTEVEMLASEEEPVEAVAVSEGFIATTSTYVPATVGFLDSSLSGQSGSSVPETLATTPSTVLRYVYLGIGALIITMLLLSIAVSVRYHRPWQLAYGIGILILMSGLFYLQSHLTTAVVLADSGTIFVLP